MKTDYKTAYITINERVAIITVKSPPFNRISGLFADEMHALIDLAFQNNEVKAIVITGSEKHFVAGMDIETIRNLKDKNACLSDIMKLHELMNFIEQGPKPVIAAINGNCSRGGLEIAMACHYRLGVNNIRLGMLEVRFGLIPGMGGTQRLPRLIGIKPALSMITSAQDISAEQGKVQGLLDEITTSQALLIKAMNAAKKFMENKINFKMCLTSKRFDKLLSTEEKKEITSFFREKFKENARGYLAPFKAIDAVEHGLSINFQSDIKLESDLFCDCAVSDISKNLIDIFINTRKTGDIPRIKGKKFRRISKIGILGSGTMGAGIAALLLKSGFEIWIWDVNRNALEKGLIAVKTFFINSIKRGEISKKILEKLMSRIHPVTLLDSFKNVDLIIESIVEDIEAKKSIFKELEKLCSKDVIFGTNTSSLTIKQLSSDLEYPERMIGLHFFNPPAKIQLLELSCSMTTGDDVLAKAVDFTKKIRKIPFTVNDGPGYYVSRQIFSIISESYFLVSEGINPFTIEKAFTEFGFPLGFARWSDLTGLDTLYFASKYLESALEGRWSFPLLCELIYKSGCYGRKTGSGWYDYTTDNMALNVKFMEVVRLYLKENNITPKNMCREDILEQIIARSINEGTRTIQEGISYNVADMDIAMVYGVGFPPYRGGIFRYADSWGIDKVYDTLLRLEQEKGIRFQPTELIKQMAESGRTFYQD